jgi:carboxyl-terminal processing protease
MTRMTGHTARRCAVIVVMVLSLALIVRGGLSVNSSAAPSVHFASPEQIATHLATVRAAYGQILDAYVRPLDPGVLLQPALDAVLDDAANAGRRLAPPDVPRITLRSDRELAFSTFGDAYRAFAGAAGEDTARSTAFHAIDAMVKSPHDDHTSFLPPGEMKRIGAELSGTPSSGSGLNINRGSPPFVSEVAPNGPADKAGLKPGDTIVSINGEPFSAASPNQFSTLRGESGRFTMRVDRPGTGSMDVTVTPGSFSFPVWTSTVLPDAVGYMRLRVFIERPAAPHRGVTGPAP